MRRTHRATRRNGDYHRRLRIEPLEVRSLLTLTLMPAGQAPAGAETAISAPLTSPATPAISAGLQPADTPIAQDDSYTVKENESLDELLSATLLQMVSQPGDPIASAGTYSYDESGYTFSVSRNSQNGVSISVNPPPVPQPGGIIAIGFGPHLDFAAPGGAALAPGTYSGAQQYPSEPAGAPGICVSLGALLLPGGTQLTGQFTVDDVEYDASGNVLRFDASFEEHLGNAAAALTGRIQYDEPVPGSVSVLANDSSPDGGALTAVLVAGPQHGTLTLQSDGGFLYTPNAGFTGTDSFQYVAEEGAAQSNVATVTLDVIPFHHAPVGTSATISVPAGPSYALRAADFGFADPQDSPPDTFTQVEITTLPTSGSLALLGTPLTAGQFVSVADLAAGNLVFTPATGGGAPAAPAGRGSFTFQVEDSGSTVNGGANLDPVPKTLTINFIPVAQDDSYSVNENQTLDQAFLGNHLRLTYTYPSSSETYTTDVDGVAQPCTVTMNGNVVTFTYPPATGFAFPSHTVQFAAAGNAPLAPGLYSDAQATADATHPGLSVDSSQLGLVTPARQFTVIEAVYAPAGDIERFDATFVLQDPTTGYSLAGHIQYNASAIEGTSVLQNDSDEDGDPLTAAFVSGPQHGNLTFDRDGGFVYVPDQNFSGTDSFQYQASDGTALSKVATVTINVAHVSQAPTGHSTTLTPPPGAPYALQAADFGFSDPNDFPPDAFTAVEITTLPTSGSLTLAGVPVAAGQFVGVADLAAGNLVFTPTAGSPHPSFTFQVEDSGSTASGGVNLDPVPKTLTFNVAPVARDDSYTVDENQTLDESQTAAPGVVGLLQNDTDADGDPLTAVLVTGPSAGTLSLESDGGFVYTPDPYFSGTDTFQYEASDGMAPSKVATVTITVDHVSQAPSGTSSAVNLPPNTAYVVQVADFGFTDPHDDPPDSLIGVEISTPPANGSLTLAGAPVEPGQFVGIADIAAGNLVFDMPAGGPRPSFAFQVEDSGSTANGGSTLDPDPKTLSFNIPPVATDASYATRENTELDQSGSVTRLTMTSQPGDWIGGGSNYDFSSADSTFTAYAEYYNSVMIGCSSGNEWWYLSFAPPSGSQLVPGVYDGATRFPFEGAGPGLDVSGDGRGSNELTGQFTILQAVYGSSGEVLQFDATFEQHSEGAVPALVGHIRYNATTTATAIGITANVSDANGDPLSFLLVTGPQHGSVDLEPTGYFVYSPDAGFSGTDSFQYKANDGAADSNVATVTITVIPPPLAQDDAYTVDENQTLDQSQLSAPGVVGLLQNDTSYDGNPLSAVLVSGPQHGTLSLDSDGGFVYTPDAYFSGTDTFQYEASDGTADSNVATAAITVNHVSQAPSGTSGAVTILRARGYTVRVSDFGFSDPHDDPPDSFTAVEITTLPGHGTLQLAGTQVRAGQFVSVADIAAGKLVFIPAVSAGSTVTTALTFQVEDAGSTANGGVNLDPVPKTLGINIGPVAQDDAYVVNDDHLLRIGTGNVLANDLHAAAGSLSAILVSGPQHGRLTLNANGSFTYTPNTGFYGTDGFQYRASDGVVRSNVARVTIAVTHVVQTPGSALPDSFAFSPQTVCSAYGIDSIHAGSSVGNGAGQTIVIVAAYDNPAFVSSTDPGFLQSDLHQFDVEFGLPDPPSFRKLDQNGGTNYPAAAAGEAAEWAGQIAMDVEWAHAVAPRAKLVLIEANHGLADTPADAKQSFFDLLRAVDTARHLPGVSVVSMSSGFDEGLLHSILGAGGETAYDAYFTTPAGHAGVTFVAAAGDQGAPGVYPAYSPNVVGVGGTALEYPGYAEWACGTGGGQSRYEAEPAYQRGVQASGWRQMPDVAFAAGDAPVYNSFGAGATTPWVVQGGSGFSASCWAALFAIADQLRAAKRLSSLDGPSQTLPALYSVPAGDFHDITSGGNGTFQAGYLYDLVTGRGTPVANLLVPDLALLDLSKPPLVVSTSVSASNGTLPAEITKDIVVTFNKTVIGSDLAANYELRSAGPDGLLGTTDDVAVPLTVASDGSTADLAFSPLAEGLYRLTVRDRIVDIAGHRLDGNGDGLPGGDWNQDFVAIPTAMFPNRIASPTTTAGNCGFYGPCSIATGDFNGDGKLDLALMTFDPNGFPQCEILFGNGDGTFQAPVTLPNAGGSAVVAADFNGDGYTDLAVVGDDAVKLFLNDGHGVFSLASASYNPAGGGLAAALDLNGDGLPDLVVATSVVPYWARYYGYYAATYYGYNDGNGGFNWSGPFGLGDRNLMDITGLSVAEVGGHANLALAEDDPENDPWYDPGSPDFAVTTSFYDGPCETLHTGWFPTTDVALGDFNGDGREDLALLGSNGQVGILLSDPNQGFLPMKIYGQGGSSGSHIVAADFDGDGTIDLAYTGGDGLEVLLGDGHGGFAPPMEYRAGWGARLLAGDFNNDGKLDLVETNVYSDGWNYPAGGYADHVGVLLNSYNPPVALKSADGTTFDVATGSFGAGELVSGSTSGGANAFNGYGRLFVDGTPFQPAPLSYQTGDDGQSLTIGSGAFSGLTVSREITVPNTGNMDFVRTVDTFANPTDAPITTAVKIIGNLGSDAATTVFATSSGSTVVQPGDAWIGTDDGDGTGSPAVIHYIHAPGSLAPASISIIGDNIEWTYRITVPAGQTVSLAYFAILATTRAEAVRDANGLLNGNVGAISDLASRPLNFHVAPVAVPDSYAVNENATLNVPAVAGVLRNDTDAGGDPLTAVLTSGPWHGTLALAANGGFLYTPNRNFCGWDAFQYQAGDGLTDSTVATVSIYVRPVLAPPSGTDKTITMAANSTYTLGLGDFGFKTTFPPIGQVLAGSLGNLSGIFPPPVFSAVSITTLPAAGSLTLARVPVTAGQVVSAGSISKGLLTFTPAANASGTPYASFTFQVEDNGGTANGRLDMDPTPKTMTFNVVATKLTAGKANAGSLSAKRLG